MNKTLQTAVLSFGLATASPALAAETKAPAPALEDSVNMLRFDVVSSILDQFPRMDLDKIVFNDPKINPNTGEVTVDGDLSGLSRFMREGVMQTVENSYYSAKNECGVGFRGKGKERVLSISCSEAVTVDPETQELNM